MERLAWLRKGFLIVGLIGLLFAGWYAWTRVDWFDFSPAAAPDQPKEIAEDPKAKLVKLTVDAADPRDSDVIVTAGDYFEIQGRFQLDPRHWQLDQPGQLPPRERALLLARLDSLVKCRARLDIVCQSWLSPGEKRIMMLVSSVTRDGPDGVRWSTRWALRRPGVYLVRVFATEQGQTKSQWELPPPLKNERLLQTFLLTVVKPVAKDESD